MAKLIRWHEKSFIHFVTNRTEHEMFLLLPTQEVNNLILYWLTKAKEIKGLHIKLYAFVFLSNHFHMLLQDPKGELAEFMGYFQGNLAKALNKLHHRKGKFWYREYDDLIVDGEDEFWNRYGYIAANPVKAGLVTKPDMWKGVSSVHHLCNNNAVVGTGVNVTKYGNATRHGKRANKKEFVETFSFSLAIPPMLAEMPSESAQKYLTDFIATSGQCARTKRGAYPPLGMNKVLSQKPLDRPHAPSRKPRFKIMSFCKERKKLLQEKYKRFVAAYRACCQSLTTYFKSAPCQCGITEDDFKNKHNQYKRKAPVIIWPLGCHVPTHHKPVVAQTQLSQ